MRRLIFDFGKPSSSPALVKMTRSPRSSITAPCASQLASALPQLQHFVAPLLTSPPTALRAPSAVSIPSPAEWGSSGEELLAGVGAAMSGAGTAPVAWRGSWLSFLVRLGFD